MPSITPHFIIQNMFNLSYAWYEQAAWLKYLLTVFMKWNQARQRNNLKCIIFCSLTCLPVQVHWWGHDAFTTLEFYRQWNMLPNCSFNSKQKLLSNPMLNIINLPYSLLLTHATFNIIGWLLHEDNTCIWAFNVDINGNMKYQENHSNS